MKITDSNSAGRFSLVGETSERPDDVLAARND